MIDTVGFIVVMAAMLLFAIWDTGLADSIKCLMLLVEAGRLFVKLCYLAPGAFVEWIVRNRKPDIAQMARDLGLDKPMQRQSGITVHLDIQNLPSWVLSPPQTYTPLLEDEE